MLNRQQIDELLQIISRSNLFYLAKQFGTGILTEQDKKILESYGINLKSLGVNGKVDEAFAFGLLAGVLGEEGVKNMNYSDLKNWMNSDKYLPLNQEEENAVEALKNRAYFDIKSLSNKVEKDVQNIVIENDKEYNRLIKEAAKKGLQTRKSNKQIASDMMKKTQDWARDFDRIADYVTHEAYDHGKAASIKRIHGDNALVYKIVQDGACSSCTSLYLNGKKPKIFKLSELLSNGSNIGKKQREWKPVIGATHPWCRCELEYLPLDMEWDEETGDFTKPVRNDKGVKRKSKARIKIT